MPLWMLKRGFVLPQISSNSVLVDSTQSVKDQEFITSGETLSTILSLLENAQTATVPEDDGSSYILQRGGFDCLLVALINALRYFKRPTPRFRSPEYQELVRLSGSTHGPATRFHEACEHLGLKITHVPYNYAIEHAPGIVSVENPHPGTIIHAVFVTPEGIAINHRWLTGPVECPVDELIPWRRFGNWTVELV
jgi:hypothetical protein